MNPHVKNRLKKFGFSVPVLLVLMVAFDFSSLGQRFEQMTLDLRYFYLSRQQDFSDQVVFIDIDDISIKNLAPTYGRWPWPRRVYRDALEFLQFGEPKIIAFDILFTEQQKGGEDDQLLADAGGEITSHAIQLLPETTYESDNGHNELKSAKLESSFLIWEGAEPKKGAMVWNDYLLPNPTVLAQSALLHVTNVEKDSDGRVRRVPLYHKYGDKWLPSLTLTSLMAGFQQPSLRWEKDRVVLLDQGVQKHSIPLSDEGNYFLNYYSKNKSPNKYTFSAIIGASQQLLSGEVEDPEKLLVNPMEFEGKIIVIGGSANGLMDLKESPVGRNYPGPQMHITAISNILQNYHLKRQSLAASWGMTVAMILFIYGAVLFLQSQLSRNLLPLGLFLGFFFVSMWLFQEQNFAVKMASPFIFSLLAYLDSFVYLSFIEGREKKKISGTLSKYLSPAVAKDLVDRGVNPTAEVGSKKDLTVLFSDIRGFTSMSERLPPEQVVEVLNEYLGEMTDIIFAHQGTLDKFIGDAVMAFWGAPVDDPDHAKNAVMAAFEMEEKLAALNAKWQAEGVEPLAIGVGLNTGKVIVGNIGSDRRLDFTVIGDNVNLASRIEGLTKQYGVSLLITDSTYQELRSEIYCRPIDFVKVKGKDKPVGIWQPLYAKSSISAISGESETNEKVELGQKFETGIELYRSGQFKEALQVFNNILEKHLEDGPSRIFRQRCLDLIQNPPRDWDGIFVAKSK